MFCGLIVRLGLGSEVQSEVVNVLCIGGPVCGWIPSPWSWSL